MVQWLSICLPCRPPTNVARVRFPDSAQLSWDHHLVSITVEISSRGCDEIDPIPSCKMLLECYEPKTKEYQVQSLYEGASLSRTLK